MIGFDLEHYRDRYRVLLIFSPSEEKDIYQWQLREIDDNMKGIEERNMILVHVISNGQSHAAGEAINEDNTASLREKFKVKPTEYKAILLGKDGTTKYEDDKPVAMEDIFSIIDAMPDRKWETMF